MCPTRGVSAGSALLRTSLVDTDKSSCPINFHESAKILNAFSLQLTLDSAKNYYFFSGMQPLIVLHILKDLNEFLSSRYLQLEAIVQVYNPKATEKLDSSKASCGKKHKINEKCLHSKRFTVCQTTHRMKRKCC